MSEHETHETHETDDGMLRWFGASWGAPICDEAPHVATPIGQPCARCFLNIDADDQGVTTILLGVAGVRRVPYHLDCFLRGVLGPSHPDHKERQQYAAQVARNRTDGARFGWEIRRAKQQHAADGDA